MYFERCSYAAEKVLKVKFFVVSYEIDATLNKFLIGKITTNFLFALLTTGLQDRHLLCLLFNYFERVLFINSSLLNSNIFYTS